MEQKAIESIEPVLNELKEDAAVPKNVKLKIDKVIGILRKNSKQNGIDFYTNINKKWVSYLYRTAQPFTLAFFRTWGSSTGAGRIRLTRCKNTPFFGQTMN